MWRRGFAHRWPPRLDLVPSLLHFRTHLADDLLRQPVGPGLGVLHALIEDVGLLRQQLFAERRLVERERILELLLGEARGIELGHVVQEFRAAGSVFRTQLERDLVQVLAQGRIGLQEYALGLLDDARNQGVVERHGALDRDQLLGGRDRARRGLLRIGGAHAQRQRKTERQLDGRPGGWIGEHEDPPCPGMQAQRRSKTRTPLAPATTAACASPMNRPCSTTPAMRSSRSASDPGAAIRSSAASRIQCPPSVTKAWPSWPRRSSAGPLQPADTVAASMFRRVAASPNGTTSIGSGKRPSVDTHFDSSAMTTMRAEAEATIFSRSSAPPPPLIKLKSAAISSAPSMVRSSSGISSRLVSGTPRRSASARVTSDVGTPITSRPAWTRSASSSTKCLAVEPLPRLSRMPGRMNSRAPAAAARFWASTSIATGRLPAKSPHIGA